jgi:hypothetical protein
MPETPAYARRTGRNHGLNEVADVAQHDTEALHCIWLARLGLHRLDLYALQYRFLYYTAAGLEDGPGDNKYRGNGRWIVFLTE